MIALVGGGTGAALTGAAGVAAGAAAAAAAVFLCCGFGCSFFGLPGFGTGTFVKCPRTEGTPTAYSGLSFRSTGAPLDGI